MSRGQNKIELLYAKRKALLNNLSIDNTHNPEAAVKEQAKLEEINLQIKAQLEKQEKRKSRSEGKSFNAPGNASNTASSKTQAQQKDGR